MEIWRDVVGYEGIYQISNLGNVKSLGRYITNRGRKQFLKERLLSKNLNAGYYSVSLTKNGKIKSLKVHRLVAMAFLDNPLGYREINHIDEDKLNNGIDNLEWCSRKHNVNHGTRTDRAVISTRKPVMGVNVITGEKIVSDGMKLLEEKGFNYRHIGECCNGKRKTHKGYQWKFINKKEVM